MDVTVFIRSYNEQALIGACLEAIRSQRTKHTVQVLVLDCSSTDNTVSIAQRFDARIFSIPQKLFTYSSALNAGAQLCDTALFLPLSAHAVPDNENWLESLIAPLAKAPSLTATFSRQIPWPGDSVPEIEAREREFGPAAWQRDKANFVQLLNARNEPYEMLLFSNVSSCIRREFVLTHPFYALPFCEDRAFALDMLSSGSSFAYVPESLVKHSHYPTWKENAFIAERAMLARFAINHAAAKRFAAADPEQFLPTKGELAVKLPAVLGLSMLRWLDSWVSAPRGTKRREAAYYAALPGITVGKMRGLAQTLRDPIVALKRDDPAQLLLQAREIKKP